MASKFYWRLVFNPETPAQRGQDVDPAELAALNSVAKTWPLSTEAAQLRYVASKPAPQPGAYAGVPMVFL